MTAHTTVSDEAREQPRGALAMLGTIARCALASVAVHLVALGILKVLIDVFTRGDANRTSGLVSAVTVLWFGGHLLVVQRVAESRLPGRRGTAIAITTVLTLFEVFTAISVALAHYLARWQG